MEKESTITYQLDLIPSAEQVIELYKNAGLPRPVEDAARIEKMYQHSNLVVTAWQGEELVGVSRCITDWAWSCYLADLAVKTACHASGIGKELIRLTKEKLGKECMLLLLSVPGAMEYYPKVGFTKLDNSFIINREQ